MIFEREKYFVEENLIETKMKITKKREIIVTRERTLTIKFADQSGERFCHFCGETRQFITVDEAAAVLQIKVLGVFRLVEAKLLHFYESKTGSLLVCFQSLSEIAAKKKL